MEKHILQKVAESYEIIIENLEMLRDGSDNIVWSAVAADGKKYVIRASKRDMGGDIAFEAEWIRILKEKGIPVVSIVLTKEGRPYAVLDGGAVITIFEFLEGRHITLSADIPLPQEAIQTAAEALARLHAASRGGSEVSRRRTVFGELERVIEHESLILEKTPGGKEFVAEVTEMLSWGKEQTFTPALVHNDYRIGNIMFDESNHLLAILDFDWSCMGPAIKDVGHALAEWSYPDGAPGHSEETFEAFLAAYNAAADAPVLKDETLFRWIAFACLSDTATFLVDRLLRDEIKSPSYSYMYKKYRYFLAMK